jgi:3-oxoacyl-(acyl-carrier-protein) synthase
MRLPVREPGGTNRAVVTGFGLVTPFGTSLVDLVRRFAASEQVPLPAAAAALTISQVPMEAVPEERRGRLGRTDRLCQLLVAASYLAVEDAGDPLGATDPERIGLSFGTGLGCLLTDAEYNRAIVEGGPAAASPRLFAYTVSSAAAGEVSIALGIKGANVTAHMGLAAGLGAVGYGADLIEAGKADVILAAGADVLGAPIIEALADMDLLKPRAETRPFRDVRPGIVPAEAAVVAVLEAEDHARRRGARCLGRLDGYAAGFEPTLTHAAPETAGLAATIRRALERSGRRPGEAAAVFTSAHGTVLDDVERAAVGEALGQGAVPLLMAPKTLTGEAFGASGVLALALAAELLAAPPEVADGVGFDLGGVPRSGREARERLAAAPAVLIDALCYTGNVVALVLGRPRA